MKILEKKVNFDKKMKILAKMKILTNQINLIKNENHRKMFEFFTKMKIIERMKMCYPIKWL